MTIALTPAVALIARAPAGGLKFGEPQIALGIVFASLAILAAIGFTVVAAQAGADVSYRRVQRIGYWIRKRWLTLLVVIGALVAGISMFSLPYPTGASSQFEVVQVTGGQFFWTILPNEVPVDTPIRFNVTSIDVNHGFGLYTPKGRMIGSVQAMPGFHNKLDLIFHETGIYRVHCMEFCGIGHATMESTLKVVKG